MFCVAYVVLQAWGSDIQQLLLENRALQEERESIQAQYNHLQKQNRKANEFIRNVRENVPFCAEALMRARFIDYSADWANL